MLFLILLALDYLILYLALGWSFISAYTVLCSALLLSFAIVSYYASEETVDKMFRVLIAFSTPALALHITYTYVTDFNNQ